MKDTNKLRGIYNCMRFLVFRAYYTMRPNAYVFARDLIDYIMDVMLIMKISNDSRRKMRMGLVSELQFFHCLRDRLKLDCALDAGCRYDFIGRYMEEITHFDATKNLSFKDYDSNGLVAFAEILDQRRGVRIHKKGYREFTYCGSPLPSLAGCCFDRGDFSDFIAREKKSARNAVTRGMLMRQIQLGKSLSSVVEILNSDDSLDEDDRKLLESHLYFFGQYKSDLGLVPMLSCGDGIDFVGEKEGRLIKYCVLPDLESYTFERNEILLGLDSIVKVAVQDASTHTFCVYDVTDDRLYRQATTLWEV